MAPSSPSPMFAKLVNVWRDLSFRSDANDIVLEILGCFSLDKIYAEPTTDKQSYQRLIITLLAQLNAIIYIQRLTQPLANTNVHAGACIGLLISWEVGMRTFELLLHTIIDGREGLWDRRVIVDKHLGHLLLSGLRFLVLHPGVSAEKDKQGQANRFARLRRLLEQVLHSFPGPESVLLMACRDACSQLLHDAQIFARKPRQNLPNLTTEMYPLPGCLAPQQILELVAQVESSDDWVEYIFVLRDIAFFTGAASMQYILNQETRDFGLVSTSAQTCNAVFKALDSLPLPSYVSRPDLVATFADIFSVSLPDIPQTYAWDMGEEAVNSIALDALDMLCARLSERQVLHRVSDGAVTHSVSQVLDMLTPPGSSPGRSGPAAGLYVVNCSRCHTFDPVQMGAYNVHLLHRSMEEHIALPTQSACLECGEPVTFAREISLFRRTWELLRHLETDTRASTIEGHISTHFQLQPLFRPGTNSQRSQLQSRHRPISPNGLQRVTSDFAVRQTTSSAQDYNISVSSYPEPVVLSESHHPDRLTTLTTSIYPTTTTTSRVNDHARSISFTNSDSPVSPESRYFGTNWASRKKSGVAPDKGRPSRWKFSLGSSKKQPHTVTASVDSSSLSSSGPDAQKLEEIPLDGLFSVQKSSRGKKVVNTYVSTTSNFVLFWAQTTLQIWDASTSPATMIQTIFTENSCLLAAVSTSLVAYIISGREQKLTLRIVNLANPARSTIEYRMPSTQWCRSIAIEPVENYVVVGFDGAAVRFYKAHAMQAPREDRLHGHIHSDCKNCAAVGTLSFSPDGLALLASTRSPKTGVIQMYLWRYPFLDYKELLLCRYPVPLSESEDSGVSSVILKSGTEGEEDVISITTWTQSGTPILVNPLTGHKTPIQADEPFGTSRLGTKIQCAAFSPSSDQLAAVNDKGDLYLISYQTNPMETRRLATTKDLPARTNSFGMNFITDHGDDYVVLAWADVTKKTGWVKKVHIATQLNSTHRLEEAVELAQCPMGTAITEADLAGYSSSSDISLPAFQFNARLAELPVRSQIIAELEAPQPAFMPIASSEHVMETPIITPAFS